MPNAAPRPWKMFIPLAGMVLLGMVWTAYWFVVSGIVQSRFEEQRAQLAARGLTLSCTTEEWGGFPFHFEFTCTSPVAAAAGTAELRSGNLLLVALAYAPSQVVALLDGPTTVSATGILPTRAEHQRIIGAFTASADEGLSVTTEVPALAVPGVGSATRLLISARTAASGGVDIALSFTAARLEFAGKPPVTLDEGQILGTLSPDGMLDLGPAEIRQGQLRLSASGRLALDAMRRPSGRIDAETNDVKALLGALDPFLQLTDEAKAGLRTMLGLLGSEAKAPIIARDGVLYLGPFELGPLAPLY